MKINGIELKRALNSVRSVGVSLSGNGEYSTEIRERIPSHNGDWNLGKGFYLVADLRGSYLVAVDSDGKATAYKEADLARLVEERAPHLVAESAKRKADVAWALPLANKAVALVCSERGQFGPITRDGVSVVPEWSTLPTPESVAVCMLDGYFDTTYFVKDFAVPACYLVQGTELRGADAEEALKLAKEFKASSLPALAGSPKQLSWASQIREKVARVLPSFPALKEMTEAKWWIDNRFQLADIS